MPYTFMMQSLKIFIKSYNCPLTFEGNENIRLIGTPTQSSLMGCQYVNAEMPQLISQHVRHMLIKQIFNDCHVDDVATLQPRG